MEQGNIVFKPEEVRAVLEDARFLTRPPSEPVPADMQGSALGEIYARLARVNDGERHDALRARVDAILAQWDLRDVESHAREGAAFLEPQDLSAYVVCRMIGIDPVPALPLIRAFAGAIGGNASRDDIRRGISATPSLIRMLPDDGSDPDERANTFGLLFQSFAPSRALIESRAFGTAEPPVPLTRRWAAADLEIFGKRLRRGNLVVVLLTAPEFHFGAGPHRCPGREIAETIAATARPSLAMGVSAAPSR